MKTALFNVLLHLGVNVFRYLLYQLPQLRTVARSLTASEHLKHLPLYLFLLQKDLTTIQIKILTCATPHRNVNLRLGLSARQPQGKDPFKFPIP